MRARIHRGANEVGGNCVELEHDGARLVLDVGRPLTAGPGDVVELPDVPGLAGGDDPTLLGVILTHGHADHWGLMPQVHPAVPRYIGKAAADVLRAAEFWGTGIDLAETGHLEHRKPFTLGPFTITPYLADHSAFDAYSLLIQAGPDRLFYTGDISGHGRKAAIFEQLLADPPTGIDVLLCEGTNVHTEALTDTSGPPVTESDVEKGLAATMRATEGVVVVLGSPQNIDSKLCSKQAMGHIHSHGGRFVTIVPHGRREDTWFRDWAQTHAPAWTQARRAPGARQSDPDRIWRTFEAPAPSVDGYRVIWVHSSSKAARDAQARAARIEAGLAAIDTLATRLTSPKTRIKTKVAAEQAASTALASAGATRWVGFTITETTQADHRQEERGRPGAQTRYRRTEKTVFTIDAAIHADKVGYDAITDGCFPLITNDTVMTGAEVLAAYHYQPNLERRNHLLKGTQEVAPVYLETAHRIEALLLCHFLAMLTEALIEREIRTSMSNQGLAGIPLYPELRNCPAPSAPRILEIFDDVQRHQLTNDDGQIVQTFEPELTDLQQQVLDLLHIPTSVYTSTDAR